MDDSSVELPSRYCGGGGVGIYFLDPQMGCKCKIHIKTLTLTFVCVKARFFLALPLKNGLCSPFDLC